MIVKLTKDMPLYDLKCGDVGRLDKEERGKYWITFEGRGGWFLINEFTKVTGERRMTKVANRAAETEDTAQGRWWTKED